MSFATDIAALDTEAIDLFGVPVTYQPDGGAQVEIKGIFDEYFMLPGIGMDYNAQSTSPAVVVKAHDVDPDEVSTEGDVCDIDGVTWHVKGAERSGDIVILKLSRDATS